MLKVIPSKYLIIGGASGGVALLAVIVLVSLLASGVIGGGNPQPVSALDLVPDAAETVTHFNVKKVLDSDLLSEEVNIENLSYSDGLGIQPDDVSEIVIAEWNSREAVVLKGSFDLDSIRKELEDQYGEEETYRGYEVWENLYRGRAAALFKGYIIPSDSAGPVENLLKNLYNESGSLERADNDNEMKNILNKMGKGHVLLATVGNECRVERCEGYGFVIIQVDEVDKELKLEIALLFRND